MDGREKVIINEKLVTETIAIIGFKCKLLSKHKNSLAKDIKRSRKNDAILRYGRLG